MRLWLVGHNMAGYLPDSDPWYVRGKRRAVSASRSDATSDRDAMSEGMPRRERWHLTGRAGDYWLTAERGASYHYWIEPMDAERRTVSTTRYDETRLIRCDNCERTIGVPDGGPEDCWYVPETEAYLCEDCAT